MSTPSTQLAAIITKRLVAEGLIPESDATTLESKLANGTVKAEDWKLVVDKNLLKEKKG